MVSNVLFATPEHGRIKLLFIDFEYAGFFPSEASTRVTLPVMGNGPPPPEGYTDIDPFAYDVYRASRLIESIKKVCVLSDVARSMLILAR